MIRHPGVALFSSNPDIARVINQIGLMVRVGVNPEEGWADEFAVWIVDGGSQASELSKSHRKLGGAVLEIGGGSLVSTVGFHPTDHELFEGIASIFAVGKAELPHGPQLGRLEPSGGCFARDEGDQIALPTPPKGRPRAQRIALPVGATSVSEYGRAFDLGGYRRLVERALRLLFLRTGQPFLRKSHRLGGKLPFLVRIDADGFDLHASELSLGISKQMGAPFTWFVDVERHAAKGGLAFVRRLKEEGQEVQSHGWHHFVYGLSGLDKANLRRANEILLGMGIQVSGFCSPFGAWSPRLQRILDRLGFDFSSEFSYAWDDLPSVPQHSHVLQIPIHPVCPALILEKGGTPADAAAHLARYAEKQKRLGEPLLPYFHPINDLAHAVDQLAPVLASLSIDPDLAPMTFSQYAQFWRTREAAILDAEFTSSGELMVHSDWPIEASGVKGVFSPLGRAPITQQAQTPSGSVPSFPVDWSQQSIRKLRLRQLRLNLGKWKREFLTGPYLSLAKSAITRPCTLPKANP